MNFNSKLTANLYFFSSFDKTNVACHFETPCTKSKIKRDTIFLQ